MFINLLKRSCNFTYDWFKIKNILRGAHIVFMCFVRILEKTATLPYKTLRDWFL
jgi:hypothetical protein